MPLPLRYNFRSLLRRPMRALLTAGGTGLAVLVAMLMLALARGVLDGIRESGHPLNVLVTSKGAETIEFSSLDRGVYEKLRHSPEIAQEKGNALASPELYFTTMAATGRGNETTQAIVRGVLPVAFEVHDMVRLAEGRLPSAPGEILVGGLVATKLGINATAVKIGESLKFEGNVWRIVGRIEAPGTVFDSEIWGGLDDLMTASRRAEYSSIVLRAADPAAMEEMIFDFETRRDVLAESREESLYYAAYAENFAPIRSMVIVMAAMMVLGGVFIGMNTLFAAVVGRTREIGVLRVTGYRRWHIALGFLVEALPPALLGGAVACLIALGFNGLGLRIPMGAFRFQIDFPLLGFGLFLSLMIALLGSLWPLWRAMRISTIDAIRHL